METEIVTNWTEGRIACVTISSMLVAITFLNAVKKEMINGN